MISFLLKILRFWGSHGTHALLRLVLFKLRHPDVPASTVLVSMPLRLGKRDEIGVAELAGVRFEACSALRVFQIPRAERGRISVVTDSIRKGSLFGGVGTAMIMAALLAESRNARLRIVTRTERAEAGNLDHILKVYGITLSYEVEFVFAPFFDRRCEMDVFEGELFVTTSWWTTAATMGGVPYASIIYLLQEDERMFYSCGDERLRCEKVLLNRDIRFIVNTKLLFDHFVADGFKNISANGMWFEPSFPRDVFYPRPVGSGAKRKLMFYARPNNPRNLFYFGLEVIETALVSGAISLDQWDIVLVGKAIPPVVFAGGYMPKRIENLSWAEYAAFAGGVDLGLCLMSTPHPSYPPLDLAASGAVVVTNRYGNKVDMDRYSRNILCAALEVETMVAAISDGVKLATDVERRTANHQETAILSDWHKSFAEILQKLPSA